MDGSRRQLAFDAKPNARHSSLPELPDRFYVLNNYSGLFAWLENVVVIGSSIWLAMRWPLFYPFCVLMVGARQRALATLLHEATHLTLAKSRVLNKLLGTWMGGYLVFQTWAAYRQSHVAKHHGKFGTLDDPDYKFHVDIGLYGNFGPKELVKGFFLYSAYLVMGRLIASNSDRRELFKMGSLWIAIGYAVGWQNVGLYWLLPMLLAFGPLGFLIEVAEHWPLMRSEEALYQTRNRASSVFEIPLVGIHRERFHLVHHLFPRVPMHSLKAVDAYLSGVWPEYERWNASNGGIFLSANSAPPLVVVLFRRMMQGT